MRRNLPASRLCYTPLVPSLTGTRPRLIPHLLENKLQYKHVNRFSICCTRTVVMLRSMFISHLSNKARFLSWASRALSLSPSASATALSSLSLKEDTISSSAARLTVAFSSPAFSRVSRLLRDVFFPPLQMRLGFSHREWRRSCT